MTKGIILDLSGLPGHSGRHWEETTWQNWQKAGVLVAEEHFRAAYAYAGRELARALRNLPPRSYADMVELKMNIALQRLSQEALFPPGQIAPKAKEIAKESLRSAKEAAKGMEPALRQLSGRMPLALIADYYGDPSEALSELGLKGYFRKVLGNPDGKPAENLLAAALDSFGLKPEEALVISDDYEGALVPAQKMGCEVLWLKGDGWTPEEKAEFNPATIASLDEVLAFLDKS